MVDNNGDLHELPWFKAYMISQIQNAHKRGLKIFLSIRPQYGGFTSPQKIPENVRSIYLTQLTERVLEWAEICEKWGVELFAPIQECELLTEFKWENGELVGDEDISKWIQEILPQIKERYHGEIVCGGGAWGGSSPEAWKLVLDNCNIDFTGYDYIGFGPYIWHLTPEGQGWRLPDPTIEEYREYIRYSLTTLNEWAERDGCKGVIIREMGGPTENIQVVLEEGEDILKGIITWHWRGEYSPIIRYWFKERLP